MALYHVIDEDFDLVDAKLRITVASQKHSLFMLDYHPEHNPWVCVKEIDFFKAEDTDEWEDDEFGKVRRDDFATVQIPQNILKDGDYCVKVEVVTPSNTN